MFRKTPAQVVAHRVQDMIREILDLQWSCVSVWSISRFANTKFRSENRPQNECHLGCVHIERVIARKIARSKDLACLLRHPLYVTALDTITILISSSYTVYTYLASLTR